MKIILVEQIFKLQWPKSCNWAEFGIWECSVFPYIRPLGG